MSPEEKIGQLNQYNDDREATGPVTIDSAKASQVRLGQVGSLLSCTGTGRTRHWQDIAMQSRLKISLLFGQDVIHGYRTNFPIPLAESCRWDLEAIGYSAWIPAEEASAAGILWTFASMLDIARDPRWGGNMAEIVRFLLTGSKYRVDKKQSYLINRADPILSLTLILIDGAKQTCQSLNRSSRLSLFKDERGVENDHAYRSTALFEHFI
jgi:beta-glucosidase